MIWEYIQNQILGMKWLNELIGNVLAMMGLDINTRVGGSIQFFIYDVLKITVLLCFLIYVISYIQSNFPPERSKKIMGRFKGISANCIAALLGTVTPFCSCSSIPLFIGFTSAGLPLGVTFSWQFDSFDEYFWNKSCSGICCVRTCDCSSWWYLHRKNAFRKLCGGFCKKCKCRRY